MHNLDSDSIHFDIFDKKNRYIYVRLVLILCILVLSGYAVYNIFKLGTKPTGYACFVTAALLIVDYIYIEVRGRLFNNLIISIIGFTLLCTEILFFKKDSVFAGKVWILLLPLIVFYTQSIGRSVIYITVSILILIINLIVKFSDNELVNRLNTSQLIVFVLLSFMTYIYARSARAKNIKIKEQLYTDYLTGLPNRNALLVDMEDGVYRTLALINMDNFKNVNNLYGTKVGDEFLKHIAYKLSSFISGNSKIRLYKMHADEFAICTITKKSNGVDRVFYNKLLFYLSEAIEINSVEIYPTFTIGLQQGVYNILEDADMALKRAKELKKNILLFDPTMDLLQEYKNNQESIKKLKQCLNKDKVMPLYQPIYSLDDNSIYKYEALVRIECDNCLNTPNMFLDISKQVKLYHLITKNMIDKTFTLFKECGLDFSLNLDYDDFSNEETITYLINKIVEYGLGHQITFEILESSEIDNVSKVIWFINIVKELGCKIAIDDFGSGYSNFNYLIKFRVDYVKIDASLIRNIDIDDSSKALTKSIVSFAKELNIKTIAEHVDRVEIYDFVKSIGIDYAQGFYLGRPEINLAGKLSVR